MVTLDDLWGLFQGKLFWFYNFVVNGVQLEPPETDLALLRSKSPFSRVPEMTQAVTWPWAIHFPMSEVLRSGIKCWDTPSIPSGVTLLEARAEKSQGFQATAISSLGTVCVQWDCHFSSTFVLHVLHLISLWSFGFPLTSNSLHILHQLLLLVECQNGLDLGPSSVCSCSVWARKPHASSENSYSCTFRP